MKQLELRKSGMAQRLSSLFGLAALVLTIGCDRGGSAKPAKSPPAAAAAEPMATVASAESSGASDAVKAVEPIESKPPAPSPTEPSASDDATPSTTPATEAAAKEKPAAAERIAILTPGGPLLIDVAMTLDGRPYAEDFDKRLQQTLEAADSNDDGQPTWKELVANDDFLRGQSQGMPETSAQQKRMWVEQYDLNEDGHFQRAEAASWLGRDAGRTAAAFAIRSSRSYVPNPGASSRLWPFIDGDGNGELSTAELTAAPATLLSLDADDDQVLTPAELVSLREQLMGANRGMATATAGPTRDAALQLEPGYVIERLDYLLPDLYSPHQPLAASSFRDLPRLFGQLDADASEGLDREELAGILTIDPHLKLEVAFNAAVEGGSPTAKIMLVDHASEVAVLPQDNADQLAVTLGGTRLLISAHDLALAAAMNPRQTTDRSQIRLMVHDQGDVLLAELDANGDGQLGAREIALIGERLLQRDADGDGQLATSELPYSMVVAFLRGESATNDTFYVPPVKARSSASTEGGAPAWFRHADFNGDGDVSRREFLGSRERFSAIDADQNGFISPVEAVAVEAK